MNIIHRLGFVINKRIEAELRARGCDASSLRRMGGDSVALDVDESSHIWPWIKANIDLWGAVDVARTEFTDSEISSARAFEVLADHLCYPEPKSGRMGYLDAVYSPKGFCRLCGVGKSQMTDFLIRSTPKWGGRGFMQLHWVYDELFVRNAVYDRVLRAHGIGVRRVLDLRREALADVLQLEVCNAIDVDMSGVVRSKCEVCLETKYQPSSVGMFPPLRGSLLGAWEFRRTNVWFGEGALACRRLIVGGELGRAMLEDSPKGLALRPVSPG